MPKPNTLTDRDRRIIQSAVSFRIICGVKRLGAAALQRQLDKLHEPRAVERVRG